MSAPSHGVRIKFTDRRKWHNMSMASKVKTKRWLAHVAMIANAEAERRMTNLLIYGHSHPELFAPEDA